MANVRFRLNLLSSTTVSDRLDFTVEKAVTVAQPFNSLSRAAIVHTAPVAILGTGNADLMMYVKNLDTTNFVNVTNAAGHIVSKVLPGLFVLIAVPATAGVSAQADTASVSIEYGYWSLP